MKQEVRIHDLLQPAAASCVTAENAADQEAINHWLEWAPLVVVRRPGLMQGRIAVGVRGKQRSERYAAWLGLADIEAVHRPQDLRCEDHDPTMPALIALQRLQQRWKELPYAWGPVGSVGFALASGRSTLHAASDLDLLLRLDVPPPNAVWAKLLNDTEDLPCNVDVQVQAPQGSVALAELAANSRKFLLRANEGVRLVRDPWAQ
ncbi:malonate decarboxylase holo-ACP synthase [Granulicella cerasi]|uniref:Malonate decarboxylase holo-ACP synthase n=1 Tax=Granulicella cerasi TaxID=741063 RepID=A0ABW1Z7S3_9BACT|nr:malonate decarboxylase holo-ACP synthase [Granulicella cerasi]